MLPDVRFSVANERTTIPLRSDRGEITVVLWRHPFECSSCNSYVQSLAESEDEFRIWEARLIVIASPSTRSAAPAFATEVTDKEILPLQGVGVLAADRYGQIFYVTQSTTEHAFPSARDLAEWIKYLGTLCPE